MMIGIALYKYFTKDPLSELVYDEDDDIDEHTIIKIIDLHF